MPLSLFQFDPIKKALTGLFVLGTAGAGTELLLLGHYEDWTQWIPLTLLTFGLGISLVTLIAPGRRSQIWFRWMGIVYAAGGLLGIFLHLKGNREFELEMYPDLGGAKLMGEALTGATPALAPGVMVQLGLLAIIITFIASGRAAPVSPD
ncbi:MAG: peptidoglycan/LPS O-acetylase OafA/YrhL [Rhodothermales bacterium]|jgi:peptidoglycan/LPS O-acetylase OafA/YrhL